MNDFSLTRVIVNRWIPLKSAMKMFTQTIRFKIRGNQFHHRNSMSIIAHRFVDLVRNIRGTRANGGDRPRNLINAGKGPLKKLVPWKWGKGTLKIPSGKMSEKKSCSKFYSVKTTCAVKCLFAETTNVIPESSVIYRESLIRKRSGEIRNTKNIRNKKKKRVVVAFVDCEIKKGKRRARRMANRSCTEEVVPRAYALVFRAPAISSPRGPVSFTRNIFIEGNEKKNQLEWLIRENGQERSVFAKVSNVQ